MRRSTSIPPFSESRVLAESLAKGSVGKVAAESVFGRIHVLPALRGESCAVYTANSGGTACIIMPVPFIGTGIFIFKNNSVFNAKEKYR